MLACILDYQMPADLVWENAKWFAEDCLDDPDDLWDAIIAIHRWNTDAVFRRYVLHHFPAAHDRVQRIGKEIVGRYNGDARKSLEEPSPGRDPEPPDWDAGWPADLTDDRRRTVRHETDIRSRRTQGGHPVRRVLGRVFTGEIVSADDALRIAKQMEPRKSWKLDASLYRLGQSKCKSTNPKCEACYLRKSVQILQDERLIGTRPGARSRWWRDRQQLPGRYNSPGARHIRQAGRSYSASWSMRSA